jgi:hypothetical protein
MISNLQSPPHQKTVAKPNVHFIDVSPILRELAHIEKADVFRKLKTSLEGLSRAEAEARRAEYGPDAAIVSRKQVIEDGCGFCAVLPLPPD